MVGDWGDLCNGGRLDCLWYESVEMLEEALLSDLFGTHAEDGESGFLLLSALEKIRDCLDFNVVDETYLNVKVLNFH